MKNQQTLKLLSNMIRKIVNEETQNVQYFISPSDTWKSLMTSTIQKDDPKSVKLINSSIKTTHFDTTLNKYLTGLEQSLDDDYYTTDNVYDVFNHSDYKNDETYKTPVKIRLRRINRLPIDISVKNKLETSLMRFCKKYNLELNKSN